MEGSLGVCHLLLASVHLCGCQAAGGKAQVPSRWVWKHRRGLNTDFSSEHGWSDATPTCRARPGAQRSTWLRRHQEGTSHGDTSAVGTRNVWRVPPEHPKCGRGSCLSPGRSEQCRVAVERGEVLSTAQKAERQVRRQQLRHHFCSLESIFFSICSKV